MAEVSVTFTEDEARALLPWKGADHSTQEWNRRVDNVEDAQSKIRAALREIATEQPEEQGSLM